MTFARAIFQENWKAEFPLEIQSDIHDYPRPEIASRMGEACRERNQECRSFYYAELQNRRGDFFVLVSLPARGLVY